MRNTENLDGGHGVASNDAANSAGATRAVPHRNARRNARLVAVIIAIASLLCCAEYVIHVSANASAKAIKAIVQSLMMVINVSIIVRWRLWDWRL